VLQLHPGEVAMRFVVFLLAAVTALTAAGTLMIGIMVTFTDNPHDPTTPWGYALIAAAAAACVSGALAALLIWIKPRAAGKFLWLAVVGGVAGMAIQGVIMYLVRNHPNPPDALNIATAVLAGGLVPAVAACVAALLTRGFVIPKRLAAV
jgi:hypothetical protein